jgi:hypothetical protein
MGTLAAERKEKHPSRKKGGGKPPRHAEPRGKKDPEDRGNQETDQREALT